MHGLSTYLRRHHIGLLALFIALGGTSYAAVNLSANSVGARELKKQAVGSPELKNGSVTKRDLRPRLVASLRGAGGPTGPVGPKGDAGPTGPAGPAGPAATAAETPAARVRRTTDTQIVPTAAGPMGATVVQFPDPTAEQYDIGGMFDQAADNTVLTIPVTGTYIVTGAVRWAASSVETPGVQAGGMRNLFLHGPTSMTGQGGIRASSSVPASTTTGDTTRQNVATTERFNAGDEVFLSVSQTSGESIALDASQNQIHLSAAFIGP
jgi:hypothetical protein